MSSNPVQIDMAGNIARITLNRPSKLNALSPPMLSDLRHAISQAPQNGARAILISGAGRAFCTGADLAMAASGDMPPVEITLRDYVNPLIETLADSPVPIICAVNGPAAGAGAAIALSGDLILAARSAYFLLPFAANGMVPDAGVLWLTARSIGRARTMELALLAERLNAQDALEIGLINRVTDDLCLMTDADVMAQRIAAMPTVALGLIRQQVSHALTNELTDCLTRDVENQIEASLSQDVKEGVAAFLEKRPPKFTGR